MREDEIRSADLLAHYLRLSGEDAAVYFPVDGARVERPCPGCGADAPDADFTKNGFPVVRCPNCQTLYVSAVPTDERLSDFYRASPSQKYWATVFFPAVAEARREKIFRPRVRKIAEILSANAIIPNTMIDVGAGTGVFIELCREEGLSEKHLAVEPSENLIATLEANNIPTFQGFACDAAADAEWANSADLVTSFEVIEHVTDPETFIRDIARLAKPGGHILLTGICGTGFDILSLGANANAVTPPHHLTLLSHRGVRDLLARLGLEEVEFLTPGQLDVDIVRNAIKANPTVDVDPFARYLVEQTDAAAQSAFQTFLTDHGLSSHMWILARKPA